MPIITVKTSDTVRMEVVGRIGGVHYSSFHNFLCEKVTHE